MNIRNKIITNTVIISFVLILASMSVLLWQSNKLGTELLFSIQKDRLTSIRYFKTLEIQAYFDNLIENTSMLASNREVISSLQNFSRVFPNYLLEANNLIDGYKSTVVNGYMKQFNAKYKHYNAGQDLDPNILLNGLSENSLAFQYNYIFNNPYTLDKKGLMQVVNDGTNYSVFHAKYHPIISAYKQQYGFYDIFLVNNIGNIVYSVNKEIDFATSLTNGPYAKYSLGEIFAAVMDPEHHNDFIAIADFAPYLAYYNNQAAFVGAPIYNEIGNKIGAVIIEISVEKINQIISNQQEWKNIGLGTTINTSIIGADLKLRTNNRFFLENKDQFLTELQKVGFEQEIINTINYKNSLVGILTTDTIAVRQGLAGKQGFAEYTDYRGIRVVSSFSPLKIPGLNWVMVVKMDKEEALSWIKSLRYDIMVQGIVIAVLFGIISIFLGSMIAKSIARHINEITFQINDITQTKDLTKRLIKLSNSEFSVMINAFNNFISSLQKYLINIIQLAKRGKLDLNSIILAENNHNTKKQDSMLSEALCNEIESLSQEFKIIEEFREKTKYW